MSIYTNLVRNCRRDGATVLVACYAAAVPGQFGLPVVGAIAFAFPPDTPMLPVLVVADNTGKSQTFLMIQEAITANRPWRNALLSVQGVTLRPGTSISSRSRCREVGPRNWRSASPCPCR